MGRSLTRVDKKRRRVSRKVSISFSASKSHSLIATSFPVFIAGVRSTTRWYPVKTSFSFSTSNSRAAGREDFEDLYPLVDLVDRVSSNKDAPCTFGWLTTVPCLPCLALRLPRASITAHRVRKSHLRGDLAVTHPGSQDLVLSSFLQVFRRLLLNPSLRRRCQGRRRSLWNPSESASEREGVNTRPCW